MKSELAELPTFEHDTMVMFSFSTKTANNYTDAERTIWVLNPGVDEIVTF